MIGKPTAAFWVSSMSLIQFLWESALSTEIAIAFTLRFLNSGSSFAVRPSSVVQTGVKSAGCENKTTHAAPAESWNLMGQIEVSCSKSGTETPKRQLVKACSSWLEVLAEDGWSASSPWRSGRVPMHVDVSGSGTVEAAGRLSE